MMSPCDAVAERLACGDPLAELSPHAEDCPRCQGLLVVQRTLTGGHADSVEPARGFTSRMTVAASQRLVTRHRRRVVGYATLSAAAAAAITFALVHEPSKASNQTAASQPIVKQPVDDQAAADLTPDDPWQADSPDPAPDEDAPAHEDPPATDGVDEDTRALYVLSKTYSVRVSADWPKLERPLQPYGHLLQRVAHR